MNLSFSFRVSIFFNILVFPGQEKKQLYFENISSGTYRSVIPTSREYQKAQLVLNFPEVATPFSPKIHGSFLSSRSQSKAFYLYKGISLKIFGCVPCVRIPIDR